MPGEMSYIVAYADGTVFFKLGEEWRRGVVPESIVQVCVQTLERMGFFAWGGKRHHTYVDASFGTLWARSGNNLASLASIHEHYLYHYKENRYASDDSDYPDFLALWAKARDAIVSLVPQSSVLYTGDTRELRKLVPGAK